MKRSVRRRRYYTSRQKKNIFRSVVALTLAVIFFLAADTKLRPQINALAVSRAAALAESAINSSVSSVLTSSGSLYSELITVEHNSDGQVTSIKTDILKVNLLKSSLIAAIEKSISEFYRYEISIPLGSLTGLYFLAGRGPNIKVKITLTGYAGCNITNAFLSAGINQTLHRMMLNVNATVCIVLPDMSTSKDISTEFCIAETVIVGYVPDFYASGNISR